MTPSEVLIYNTLCNRVDISEDAFAQVIKEVRENTSDPRDEFEKCLEVLKRRGLILY